MRAVSKTLLPIIGFAASLIACESTVAPLPPDARLVEPPAVYRRWWAMVEACSGLTGDLGAVRWYEAPGDAVPHPGGAAAGYWQPVGNAIVIAHGYSRSGAMVRHEMLHALLRRGGHPRAQFLGTCAAVVGCTGDCVQDAGPCLTRHTRM